MATGVIDVSRTFHLRTQVKSFVIQEDRLRASTAEIKAAMDKVSGISNINVVQDGPDFDRLQYFMHVLRIYEVEFSVQLKEWKRVTQIVEVLFSNDLDTWNFYIDRAIV